MNWELDYTGDTPESMDQTKVAKGWHRATVIKAEEDAETMHGKLTFRITSAPFVGAVTTETLHNPQMAKDEKEMEWMSRKAKLWFHRLGVVDKAAAGQRVTVDLSGAVGRELVLHFKERTYEDRKGRTQTGVGIDFAGVYPLDHPEIPVAERKRMGLPLLPCQDTEPDGGGDAPAKKPRKPKGDGSWTATPTAASPAAPDFSDV